MLKTKTRRHLLFIFSMFLSGCVVANDSRTSLHRFIIANVYWVCLATESMNEIYVNNFKDEIARKKNTNNIQIHIKVQYYLQRPLSISLV
jgi:thioredoxin-related protein